MRKESFQCFNPDAGRLSEPRTPALYAQRQGSIRADLCTGEPRTPALYAQRQGSVRADLRDLYDRKRSRTRLARTNDGSTHRFTHRHNLHLLLLAFGLSSIFGCAYHTDDNRDPSTNDMTVTRRADSGPVSLIFTASPTRLDLSQHLQVRIEILAPSDVVLHPLDYREKLEAGERRFQYRIETSGPPTPVDETLDDAADKRIRRIHSYRLEFFLPGEYEIPGVSVSFLRPDSETTEPCLDPQEPRTLSTEPISVIVEPTNDFIAAADDPSNIARLDPVELPNYTRLWRWLVAIAALAVAAAVATVLWRKRRKQRLEAALYISPEEWARRQFAALIAEDLLGKRALQAFYYRVSGIVRGYIERRFGVSAAEMTTEEFLAAAANDGRFGRETTEDLRRFLTACDLVKYARHEPAPADCEAVLHTAQDFVQRTSCDRSVSGPEPSVVEATQSARQ